ncbi:mechanosensitive ion channel family protein [Sphingomonas morindae]|uniref:Mechanosensitive ion channel n=1 Tax=Sphingomonas morindae TaxID=1541170 RepID=A0ABY4XC96_9SPHN|nr:mechanosensitive ion channel domain-containing protein [Sphingomonas morindae]USI74351.1 mechanosensitive ion channel [Sphingomonas morindae]
MAQPLRGGDAPVTMVALVVAGVLLMLPLRVLAIRLVARLLGRQGDGSLKPVLQAVLSVLISLLAFGFGAALILHGVEAGLPLLAITRQLGQTAVAGAATFGFAFGLGRALRAEPPERRPLPPTLVPDHVYALYLPLWGLMLALSGLTEQVAALTHASDSSRALAHGLVLLVEALLLGGFLVAIGRSRDAAMREADYSPASASLALTALAWGVLLVGLIGFLVGAISFAVLLYQELIWVMLVAAFAMLLVRTLDAAIDWGLRGDRAPRRFATHVVGIRPERLNQAALLLGAAATLLIWLSAISLMIAPLGSRGVALVDTLRGGALLVELRRLHVRPGTLAAALGVLIAGVALMRMLKRWLDTRFLPATALDTGTRAAIVTGIGYACILVILLAVTAALGIDLNKVTLIAGALSVGIGFGLQSIIQNFVSGVILLAERPVKVGDWVSVAGAEGSVRHIRVRATEVVTADGSVAIVPNSSFISSAVTNRTGAGIVGRIEVPVRVGGLPGAKAAHDRVLALVETLDGLRTDPAPRLLFTDMTADGYGFTLRVYAAAGQSLAEMRSRLLYALADGLGEDLKVTLG